MNVHVRSKQLKSCAPNMYKWHVNSAIGRGRPLANDLSRVADGIASSLRMFSVSVSKATDEGWSTSITRQHPNSNEGVDRSPSKTKNTRFERSAEAVDELTSIAPTQPSRGVDARSLAAKPPGAFTITRLDETGARHKFNPETGLRTFNPNFTRTRGGGERSLTPLNSNSTYRGRSDRNLAQRGSGSMRGGRGNGDRGGMKGRGRGRGRRGGGGAGRQSMGDDGEDEDEEPEDMPDYTMEETQWQRHMEGGYADGPYEPTTSLEGLLQSGAPVLSSSQGLLSNVQFKLRTGTGTLSGFRHANEHRGQILRGTGVSAFGNIEDAKAAKAYLKDRTSGKRKKRVELQKLTEDDHATLSNVWAAGHYALPKTAELNDAIGQVTAYTRRNETYLPGDSRKFEEKLRSLLPASLLKPAASKAAKVI